MSGSPGSSPDALEERIAELRAAVRRAVAGGDREAARNLRSELRRAEHAWDEAVLGDRQAPAEAVPEQRHEREAPAEVARGLVPVREQVHQALTLLSVPAAPKLVGAVYGAFFPGEIPATRLTSLRRDEERSFRSAPYARPYYLCAALTADLLAPARGLLTVSTWSLRRRIVGPLSARVDFLTAAIRVAERAQHTDTGRDARVQRLLWRFAATIPGAAGGTVGTDGTTDPAVVAEAARAELAVHRDADGRDRAAAARRAADALDDAALLFGGGLRALPRRTGTASGPSGTGSGPSGSTTITGEGPDDTTNRRRR
ncbi:hypothetical protein [Actinomadura rupiterrae]|uniref:hypothetical protein n=1 Tax=Actinomadura rupiterrae TaxID=559627 RepID=UPI0020A4828D|nr:hypothetical protein [Actinomadura rupiterrae]MCP2340977.1 hypothetical protein [Actinomadura rupiterrae]